MAKQGIPGSRSALQRFFDRHNVSFKKKPARGRAKRADVARARRRWIREQGMLDPARLVFIDETATSTNMVRLRRVVAARGAVRRIGSAWTLENNDFRRRLAPRRDCRSLRD